MTTQRVLRARAIFGLTGPRADPRAPMAPIAARLDTLLRPGELALVTGPSGAGKSTILSEMAALVRARGIALVLHEPPPSGPAPIELIRGPLPRSLRLLSRAGLADATLLDRPASTLSAGERWRLGLAMAMHRAAAAGGGVTLLIDEFASGLDATTAAGVARMLRRWASSSPRVRTVCATVHNTVLEPLGPDVLLVQPLRGRAILRRKGSGG